METNTINISDIQRIYKKPGGSSTTIKTKDDKWFTRNPIKFTNNSIIGIFFK